MTSSIDVTKPEAGTATTQSVRDNFSAAKTEIETLQDQAQNLNSSGNLTGGAIDSVVIGGTTPAAGSFTTLNATGGGSLTGTWSDLGTVTTIDIDGGAIDGTVIGGTTPAAGSFTTITASGDVAFDTDGFFFDQSTGRVGIGTTSPGNNLEVRTSSDTSFQVVRTGGSTITLTAKASGLSTIAGGGTGGGDLSIETNSTERLRIDSSGQVGIGTGSPDGTLHVHSGSSGAVTANASADDLVVENSASGGISILVPDANEAWLAFGSPSDEVGALIYHSYSSNAFYLTTQNVGHSVVLQADNAITNLTLSGASGSEIAEFAGKVGIGVSNPQRDFVVYASSGDSIIQLANATTGAASADGFQISAQATTGNGIINLKENANILFYTNAVEVMRIDSSGNVGIASTSPSNRLEVTAASSSDGIMLKNSGGSDKVFLGADGIVDWGVTADQGTLTWDTNIAIVRANTGNGLVLQTNGGNERVRIDSSGNIGIGTSSPGYTLDVVGDVNIQNGSRSLIIGADGGATTLTDATTKNGRIMSPHYTNAEEPVTTILTDNAGADNRVSIGGGTGLGNAATIINFFAAANTTTTTGTEVARIDANGLSFDAGTNHLDTYEEDTWTPGIEFGNATTGITYTAQTGSYTRVGRVVYFNGAIILSNKGSATGTAQLTGLPFTPADTVGGTTLEGGIFFSAVSNMSLTNDLYGTIAQATTDANLSDGQGSVSVDETNFTNTTSLRFHGFYFTS